MSAADLTAGISKGDEKMAYTFKGGVHPDDHKRHTSSIPIYVLDGVSEHVFPLQQHIGAPLTPVVEIGERVKVGTKLADSEAYVSVPLHSSVSGTVKAIEKRLHPNGAMVTSVIVENDGEYLIDDDVRPKGKLEELSAEEIIKIVREAGIVGMGGAGFPTHVKLSPPKDKKIEYVIVNGAECEPYLTSDHRVLLESPEMVLFGLKAVMKVFNLSEGHIAIEQNKPDAILTVEKLLSEYEGVKLCELKTKYPQGAEKQLIKAITGREVPSGGLPADVGVVVINVDTAAAIATAIKTGMPSIRRIVTVSGDAVANPANFEVRLGVSFEYIFEKAGGFTKEPEKIIMGGPMMGQAQSTLEVPVIKGTSALLAFGSDMAVYKEEESCIRCGKCVSACPMKLMPLYLNMYALEGDLEMCEKYNILDCIECGVCSYLCPGRRHPVQNIRVAKQKILEIKRAKANKDKK